MAEYIVKTDKPIRLDEVLHLHGIYHYAVKRLEKHGRLIDADAEIAKLEAFMKVLNKETEIGGRQYHECDCVLHYLTAVIVEATE